MSKKIASFTALALLMPLYGFGLDNPDSLYSAGLVGANPHKDPYGQMKKFLGITWNFLPENIQIQKDVKQRYAQIYKSKYGQLPTEIEYVFPPSAQMAKVCQTYLKQSDQLKIENKKLTGQLAHEQAKLSALQREVDTLGKIDQKDKAQLENCQKILDEERDQCKHDIDAIQEGFGTLVAYRNAFKEKEKDLIEKMTEFIRIRYGQQCSETEEPQCKKEREDALAKVIALQQFLPIIKQAAGQLRKALDDTIGVDLAIPVEAKIGNIVYTLQQIEYEVKTYLELETNKQD